MEQKIKIDSFPIEKEKITELLLEHSAKLGDSDKVYLLSFHDDGVVWGKVKFNEARNELITSGDVENASFKLDKTPSPEFRSETLQELRLFGENGQLHVWRIGENKFRASLALDGATGEYDFLQSEEQVLHGTKTENDSDVNREFTIVADGSEGLRHAFPQNVSFKGEKRPLRLHVKHYIEYDIDGCARIAFSRLVNVSVEGV